MPLATGEIVKHKVRSSFSLLHINSGRKTTSFLHFPHSSFLVHVFSVFQEAVDLFSNRSPRRFLWEHGDQNSQFQAALDVINCPEETSLPPHCSLPQVFVEQLCLREGSGTWLPCFSPAWSSSRLGASGKTHQPSLIKPSICRGVTRHRTTGIVK